MTTARHARFLRFPLGCRGKFLLPAGVAALFALFASGAHAEEPKEEKRIRVISYNVLQFKGWSNQRAYAKDPAPRKRIVEEMAAELAKYKPDIIALAEAGKEDHGRELARLLGMNYCRFPSAAHWPGAVLSKYEIVESRNVPLVRGERAQDLFTRHWGRAVLRLPGNRNLVLYSVHLFPSDAAIRQREIAEILKKAGKDRKPGESMLMMGDFNLRPTSPEYKVLTQAGWVDTFDVAGEGSGETGNSHKPYKRIDYVWAMGPLAGKCTLSKPLFEGKFRTNPKDPKAYALSDHVPQLAIFDLGK